MSTCALARANGKCPSRLGGLRSPWSPRSPTVEGVRHLVRSRPRKPIRHQPNRLLPIAARLCPQKRGTAEILPRGAPVPRKGRPYPSALDTAYIAPRAPHVCSPRPYLVLSPSASTPWPSDDCLAYSIASLHCIQLQLVAPVCLCVRGDLSDRPLSAPCKQVSRAVRREQLVDSDFRAHDVRCSSQIQPSGRRIVDLELQSTFNFAFSAQSSS